jgi:hypothetical protein
MKTRLFLTVIGCLVLADFDILPAQLPADAEATAKLVGTWVIPKAYRNAALKGGETTFEAGGTFTSFALLKIKDQQVRIEVQGKWKVEKGVVIEQITKSSKEQMVPVGLITRDKILELTENTYLYRSEKGQERLNVRKSAK